MVTHALFQWQHYVMPVFAKFMQYLIAGVIRVRINKYRFTHMEHYWYDWWPSLDFSSLGGLHITAMDPVLVSLNSIRSTFENTRLSSIVLVWLTGSSYIPFDLPIASSFDVLMFCLQFCQSSLLLGIFFCPHE